MLLSKPLKDPAPTFKSIPQTKSQLDYLQIIEEKDAHEYKLLKYLAKNSNFQRQQKLIED